MTRVRRLGARLGPGVVLWAVIPPILERSAPQAPWMLVVLLAVLGLSAHVVLRMVASRGWFAGHRSPTTLWSASVGIAGALAALLCAGVVVAHRLAGGRSSDLDLALLGSAWLTMTLLFVLAFSGRIEFRRWVLGHRVIRDEARPFATALLGPDPATVHTFLDILTRQTEAAGSMTRAELEALAAWVRVASDDRFRRVLPWSIARPLLESFLDVVDRVGSARLTRDTRAGAGDARIVLQPLCDLIHELACDPAVRAVEITSGSDVATGWRLRLATSLVPDRQTDPSVRSSTARALLPFDVSIARPTTDTMICDITLAQGHGREESGSVEESLAAPLQLLAVSPFSGGARTVYKRGDAIIKVQRHDREDSKPTMLEDEFHLLRRLQGRSARFPTAIGYGVERTFSWIGYEYLDGEPLNTWLQAHRELATPRLLSFGVDVDEMLRVLAESGVAHRDLNPGNLIVQPTGGLALIDFDQAAAGPQFDGADLRGYEDGLAKNDLVELLHAAGLLGVTNELLDGLREAWPADGVPFSLGVFGHRFGQGWHLDPILDEARSRLDLTGGATVLDLCAQAPIAGLLLASAGASVVAVVDDPPRWQRLGSLVGSQFTMVSDASDVGGRAFDVTIAVGGPPAGRASRDGVLLTEWTGGPGRQPSSEPWFLTTAMSHIGA